VAPVIQGFAKNLIKIGFNANQVTWLAVLIGASSGVFLYFGHIWTCMILFWFSGFLDAVDGAVARLTQTSSAWGTVLDVTFDRIVELSIIFALGLLYPKALFPLLLLTGSIVVGITVFLTVGAVSEKKGVKSFYYQAGFAERTEGFILFSLMAIFQDYLIHITLVFIAIQFFTIGQRLNEARKILK